MVSRRPLTATGWIRAQVNSVRFVVDKVALGQVFIRVLWFSPVNIIPPWAQFFRKLKKKVHSFTHSPLHSSSSGDEQKASKSGRSPVRRQSHPITRIPGGSDECCFQYWIVKSRVQILHIRLLCSPNNFCSKT
jgi:hypothetical protein